jgi:hypothetical protein
MLIETGYLSEKQYNVNKRLFQGVLVVMKTIEDC